MANGVQQKSPDLMGAYFLPICFTWKSTSSFLPDLILVLRVVLTLNSGVMKKHWYSFDVYSEPKRLDEYTLFTKLIPKAKSYPI